MEGHMEIIQNEIIISKIKDFFPNCKILSNWQKMPFWHIEFTIDSIIIIIDGDISFDIEVRIDNTQFYLWQYDRSILTIRSSSMDNIVAQLEILKKFLL
jgi:hypothetical protein